LAKGIGLFDHVKHIRTIQDPDYFKNLTELDKKSFNHLMILRTLSMNPSLLGDISDLFKYFDKIPSPQFYQLLIAVVPLDSPKKYYPWVKGKKNILSEKLIELISTYFQVSNQESKDYALLLNSIKGGNIELENLCRDYGLDEKEIKQTLGDVKDDE